MSKENTPYRRVFLTGFSGTGKSAVAELVAKELSWRALDTDTLIEEAAALPVSEIFAEHGEERFREMERHAVERAGKEHDAVIATGGGAIVAIENRRAMAKDALVVALDARPQTILQRLSKYEGASERPLLKADDPLAHVIELKAAREHLYALADVIVDTEGKTAHEVAQAIANAMRTAGEWASRHPERLLLPSERDEATPPAAPVRVDAPSRAYEVHVAWGLLDRLGELLRDQGLSGAAHVVSDTNVLPAHGDRALLSLRRSGFDAEAFAIEAGEEHKRLDTAARVYDWLVSRRAERGQAIVALGGGVVGDLAGFVAATYLRGMPLVQVPTTLLAMGDAAIGGKTAVDHREGKNLIGAFHQPRLVVGDVSVLKTLPHRLLIEGFAEVIKHALILDAQLLGDLESHANDLLHIEPATTVDVLRRSVAIKASVVAQDERETTGLRALLNYGHTMGHAIEAASGYAIGHGAADAIGMMAAAEIGRRAGVTPQPVIDRQRAVLERFGLPLRARDAGLSLDANAVLDAMTLDKKVTGGTIRWVLLEDVGRAVLRSDVSMDIVRDVVHQALS